jgi:hypothetical protein
VSSAAWRAVAAAALVTVLIAGVLAPSAGARHATKFFGGVITDLATGVHVAAPGDRPGQSRSARLANLPYGGGPVLHWNHTHVIFWAPSGSGLSYDPGYETQIDTFFSDVAADSRHPTNVYGLSGQYRDAGGPAVYSSSYDGSAIATDPLPPSHCIEPLPGPAGGGPGWTRCLDDAQLVSEIQTVIRARHLPSTDNDAFFLVLPDGLGSCEFSGPENCALGGATAGSYCGYHSATSAGLLYAVIPYNAVDGHCQSGNPRPNASPADPTISTLSHEHNEIVTDPLGDAWVDESTNSEDGDLCITSFGPALGGAGSSADNEVIHGHHYWLQEEWSNEDGSCQPRDEADRISFQVPGRLRAHSSASFTGHAGDPDGAIVAYNWFFGDHGTSHSRRASHTYRKPGTYRVVLRTTDSAGNWAFYAAQAKVGRSSSRDTRRPRRRRQARPDAVGAAT